jgi:hypothetical protein
MIPVPCFCGMTQNMTMVLERQMCPERVPYFVVNPNIGETISQHSNLQRKSNSILPTFCIAVGILVIWFEIRSVWVFAILKKLLLTPVAGFSQIFTYGKLSSVLYLNMPIRGLADLLILLEWSFPAPPSEKDCTWLYKTVCSQLQA